MAKSSTKSGNKSGSKSGSVKMPIHPVVKVTKMPMHGK